MAKKSKPDQLSVVGLFSAILRNSAQQRSMVKTQERLRAKQDARRHPLSDADKKALKKQQKQDAPKKQKDTRSPSQIGGEVDTTRSRLVDTVDALKYDLDVPSRLGDARDRVARTLPRSWQGEVHAAVAAGAVLVIGWGSLAWAAVSGSRRS